MFYRTIALVFLISCQTTSACPEGLVIENDGKCHPIGEDSDVPTNPGDDDDDTVIDTDTDTDTDTDPPIELIEIDVANLYMSGQFTWDAATSTIVSGVTQAGAPMPSEFYLLFGNAMFTGDWADTNNYCMVWYELDGYEDQPFAQVEGYPFGFAIPQNNVVGGTNCAPNEFFSDQDVWPLFQNYLWKIEAGGPPTVPVQDFLDLAIPVNEHEYYVGGLFPSENFVTGSSEAIYFTGYQIDQSFNISNVRLTRAQIDNGNGISAGFYRIGFAYFWNFQ